MSVRQAILAGLLVLTACNRRPDDGAVIVSAIGTAPRLLDTSRVRAGEPSRLLLDGVAQGLVRYDAAGQIEPGLAERWIVIDDGRTYIFRLRDTDWADGQPVTAPEIASLLNRQVAPGSRNPLAPFLSAVDRAVAMTPQVVEIQLRRPRPDLLKLFAQPELALLRQRPAVGSGPFRFLRAETNPLLRLAPDPATADPDHPAPTGPERNVRLIGERAALAVLRFASRKSDLVTGGTFADWPVAAAANIPATNVRVDPAAGLFGLAIARSDGFLAEPANRAALAAAIDRTALTAAFAPGWTPAETMLPEQLDSAAAPAVPGWAPFSLADRRRLAARQVAASGQPVTLRLALPPGPGATLFHARLAADLSAIGITLLKASRGDPADLVLIDQVAPYDSARWYLATACIACSAGTAAALEAARDAPSWAERSRRIAEADKLMTDEASFIPLARPLRWSLVALRLGQWTPNPRAWHPLNRLRRDTN